MPAPSNFKCGIDVLFSGTEGTAWQEEYFYWNKPITDAKTVWIRGDTLISMQHNAFNVASVAGRQKSIVGTGVNGTGAGSIRFQCDKMWSRLNWASGAGPAYPLYTGNFNLNGLQYETGVPVIGTTGGTTGWSNSANPTNKNATTGFYYRGILDSVGDEWHVLKYADDDTAFSGANPDSIASDGKWFMMVVNPKTPCLTVTTGTTGQFYTTPPYVYDMPLIHDQTTYFQGNCNFSIHDIYGHNVFYNVNSGGYSDAGSSTKVLTQVDFVSGSNTLQYYYAGNEAYVRSRTIVKNPEFPSAGETHGNLLWGDETGYAIVTGRIARAPYFDTYNKLNLQQINLCGEWGLLGGSGFRLGGQVAAWSAGPAAINAFQAKTKGWTATPVGLSKSYATYAKEMLVENAWVTPNLGFELSMADLPMASSELNYRGYWDVWLAYEAAVAYDLLIANYRSDQYPAGITPIEDLFIRDTLAGFVHYCKMWMGGFQDLGPPGLWGSPRNTGALMITLLLARYSTRYYGTNGMDGNMTTYPWTPYKTTNYTWRQLFVNNEITLGSYPDAPVYYFGYEGSDSLNYLMNDLGQWTSRATYAGDAQVGYSVQVYRNLQSMYAPSVTHANMDSYLNQVTSAAGATALQGPESNFRLSSVAVLNRRYPVFAQNAQAYCQSLDPSDPNSDEYGIGSLQLYGFAWYDDTYFGDMIARLKRLGSHLKLKGLAY